MQNYYVMIVTTISLTFFSLDVMPAKVSEVCGQKMNFMPHFRKVIGYAEDTVVCGILCRNVLGYEYVKKGNELMVKNIYL